MQLFIQPCPGPASVEEEERVAFCCIRGTSEEQLQSEASERFLVVLHGEFCLTFCFPFCAIRHFSPSPSSTPVKRLFMSKMALRQKPAASLPHSNIFSTSLFAPQLDADLLTQQPTKNLLHFLTSQASSFVSPPLGIPRCDAELSPCVHRLFFLRSQASFAF